MMANDKEQMVALLHVMNDMLTDAEGNIEDDSGFEAGVYAGLYEMLHMYRELLVDMGVVELDVEGAIPNMNHWLRSFRFEE